MPAPYRLAGFYHEPWIDRYGNGAPTASVDVYLPGTTTRAVLHTDSTKTTEAANPVTKDGVGSKLDDLGNLTLFTAAPGFYDTVTTVNGRTGPTVRIKADMDPDEVVQVDATVVFAAGVVADNATVNTAAIQAAINSLGTYGGTVLLPQGVVVTGPLTCKTRTALVGAAGRLTVLKLAAGSNASMFTLATDVVGEVQLKNLTLDGNKANQTAGPSHGVFFRNSDNATAVANASPIGLHDPQHHLESLLIENFRDDGVRVIGRGAGTAINIQSWRNDGRGFHIGSPDWAWTNCVAGDSGRQGFYLSRDASVGGEGTGSANRLVGVKAWYSGRITPAEGNGIEIYAHQTQVVGESQDNAKHGFVFSGCQDAVVFGMSENNSNGANVNGGVAIDSGQAGSAFFFFGAERCKVVGHGCNRTPGLSKYAVEFGSTASVGCDIDVSERQTVFGLVGGTIGDNWVRRLDPLGVRGGVAVTALQQNGVVQAWGAANEARYVRVMTGGRISKVGIHVGTASGNISVAVYRRSGAGRAATTGTRLATSGAVACPAAGYAEVSLGSTVLVQPGDFLAMSCDNTTATFLGTSGGVSAFYEGQSWTQSAAHPLPSPAAPSGGTGFRLPLLIGVP